MHGQIGQNLTVHLDPGKRQTVDETRIGQRFVVGAHRSVDPLDPQGAEVALAVLAVPGGVLVCLVDRLTGDLEGVLAATVIAFRGIGDLLVTCVGNCPTFNACHVSVSLPVVGHELLDDLLIGRAHFRGATCVTDEFLGPLDHAMPLAGLA